MDRDFYNCDLSTLRLGWDVVCNVDREFDNPDTRYVLGLCKGQLLCSVRFIGLDRPNMITHTFRACFDAVPLPLASIESSRFFVDKGRSRQRLGEHYPVGLALFLAMISWARDNKYNGIHTIVSQPILTILKRSGWQVRTLKSGLLQRTGTHLSAVFTDISGRSGSNGIGTHHQTRLPAIVDDYLAAVAADVISFSSMPSRIAWRTLLTPSLATILLI